MKSVGFDLISAVHFAELFSDRFRERLDLKEKTHPNGFPHQALSQIHHEKLEALFNEQEPIFYTSGKKGIPYDEIALLVGELGRRLLNTQQDLILRAGQPLGGGSK